MVTTPAEDAADRLPAGLDFDAFVTQALGTTEIVEGAREAGISPEDLRPDASREQAVGAVRTELADLAAIEQYISKMPGDPRNAPASEEELRVMAERGTLAERVATAVFEQVLRQLRTAVERRTVDSYSTALKVADAPGLAQLSDDDYGVQTRATTELTALFGRMPGGSIGLAGRRGIGKSKLIQRLCPPPQPGHELLATVVSAPTQYDGRDFVLHLFARLCETVVGGPDARRQWLLDREHAAPRASGSALRAALLVRSRLPLLLLGLAAIAAAAGDVAADPLLIAGAAFLATALLLAHPWIEWGHGVPVGVTGPALPLVVTGCALIAGSVPERAGDPLLAAGIVAVAFALALLLTPRSAFLRTSAGRHSSATFSSDLVTTAHARLDEIQYQRTIASGWTSGASARVGAGPAELGAQAALSGTQTLAQMPLSFPEIVERLRTFLRQATTTVEVRIGIDELDKIESEETAHRFLNEIKAVFGIPRCYFLVSVSEEAMANFDRRGSRLRDVFDSSFDEILYVPPLTFAESLELLRQRVIGLPVPYHGLCHVLSGGLPRDLIRVARAMIAAKPPDADGELTAIATALVALELEQRVRAVSVVVGSIRVGPKSSDFMNWARKLPADVTAAGLLAHCEELEPFARVEHADVDTPGRLAHVQLADMSVELVAFCYFAATVIEFFDQVVAKKTGLVAGYHWTELEDLTAARAMSSANPRVGWGLISAFRETQSMRALELRP